MTQILITTHLNQSTYKSIEFLYLNPGVGTPPVITYTDLSQVDQVA